MLVDMYEVLHKHHIGQTQLLNVYHCERANSGELAGSISDAFQNSVLPTIRLFQDTAVVNDSLEIRNLDEATDFGSFSLTAALGLRAGTETSDFLAGQVKFPRLRSDMKAGFKRYGPINEADMTGNDLVVGTVTLLSNIGDALVDDWLATSDSHIVCNFVIIKRVCDVVVPEGDPCPQYRLPKTDEELTFYTPLQGIGMGTVRSQVSRRTRAT